MKLSELSLREYIAMEVFPSIIADPGKYKSSNEAAWLAFAHADAFLKHAGREHDKIAEIKRECDRLEIQNSRLLNIGDTRPRGALAEIWEFLGVDNQTAAMAALASMKVAGELSHD